MHLGLQTFQRPLDNLVFPRKRNIQQMKHFRNYQWHNQTFEQAQHGNHYAI